MGSISPLKRKQSIKSPGDNYHEGGSSQKDSDLGEGEGESFDDGEDGSSQNSR
jgi:hypothetical protein